MIIEKAIGSHMDLTQLMLGNLICDPYGQYKVVRHVSDTLVGISFEDTPDDILHCSQNEVTPIELTASIVEKCGFQKTYDDTDANGLSVVMLRMPRIRVLFRDGELESVTSGYKERSHIMYLHQLQNWMTINLGTKLEVNI